jgi:hypothetical protein
MLLAAIPLGAQQPIQITPGKVVITPGPPRPIPPGTSAIRGQILDSITRVPVAGCTLRVSASGYFQTLTSDQGGAYELKDVAAGLYGFFIQCPAHLHSCVGPDVPRGMCQVEVVRDQEREGANFYVTPGAIARGQVMTADGRPVTRASVRLGRGIRGEPTVPVRPSITDTEGRFELKNLPAGEWRLEVEIPPVPGGLRPPTIYYPGLLTWEDAIGVALEPGKVRDDLTITVPRINENVLTVVVPPPDATFSEVSVSVLQQSPLVTRRLAMSAEGIGTLKAILPGRYFVVALATSNEKRWAGFDVVDFVEDSYEVRPQLMPTGSIFGKIVVERDAPPSLGGLIVGASWVHDGAEVNPLELAETRSADDGSFRIDNLFGTRTVQVRGLGTDWEVAAVLQGRTDVTRSGIVMVPDGTIEVTIVLRRR